MTSATTQPGTVTIAQRMHQRVQTLGLTVIAIPPEGRISPQHVAGPLGRVLVQAPVFESAARREQATLAEHPGEPVELWPGLWLVGLPMRQRRRVISGPPRQPILAAVLIGPEIFQAEQLHIACDSQRQDFTAVTQQAAPSELVQSGEVSRLASMLAWLHADSTEIDRRMAELDNLSGELSDSYEELSLLYKLSTSMAVNQPPEAFLRQACADLQQVAGLQGLALQLAEDDPRLENMAGQVIVAGPDTWDEETVKPLTGSLFERYAEATEPVVIDDTQSLNIPQLPDLAQSLLVVPLRTQGKTLGLLIGGDKLDGSALTSVDSKLCDSLASTLAIFLENRMLYEDMHAMFLGTLHALTSAIDAKDSYTHGHTERVAMLARMLAEKVGLDEQTVERLYISGLVHDVGKIGVPEAVLCKPGKLTDEEFELIKMHPEIGARILQDIRQMQDLLPGVLYHHERWDGRGYPSGLAGREIPLFGRLIGLADAFDAMSSTRTYRSAMNLDEVLAEIRRCAGSQFDPELAEVFLDLDFQPFFELIEKHQHQHEQKQQTA